MYIHASVDTDDDTTHLLKFVLVKVREAIMHYLDLIHSMTVIYPVIQKHHELILNL